VETKREQIEAEMKEATFCPKINPVSIELANQRNARMESIMIHAGSFKEKSSRVLTPRARISSHKSSFYNDDDELSQTSTSFVGRETTYNRLYE
jgi:hypothetical protein